jgi:hypothetical protein
MLLVPELDAVKQLHLHLLHPPDWAYKTSGEILSVLLAICAKDIAVDQ